MKKTSFAIGAIFYAALCFFTASTAHAAITFDASSTIHFTARTTATTTIKVGTGSNGIVAICQVSGGSAGTLSSTTVNGNPTILIGSADTGNRPTYLSIYTFGAGTAQTLNVSTTLNSSVAISMGLSSFFGVNQANPVDSSSSASGAGGNLSATTNLGYPSEVITDCLGQTGTTAVTANAGQTQTSQIDSPTPVEAASYIATSTYGSISTGWTNPATTAGYVTMGLVPTSIGVQTTTIVLVASTTAYNTSLSTNIATTSFTTVSGQNKLLLVFAGIGNGNNAVTSVTFNGSNLTQIAHISPTNADESAWYMLNPPVGTYMVTTTWTSNTNATVFGVAEYTGVNQSTPIDATSTSGASFVAGNQENAPVSPNHANDMIADGILFAPSSTIVVATPGYFQGLNYAGQNPSGELQSVYSSDQAGFNNTSSVNMVWYTNYGHIWIDVALYEAPTSTTANATGTPDLFIDSTLKLTGKLFIR